MWHVWHLEGRTVPALAEAADVLERELLTYLQRIARVVSRCTGAPLPHGSFSQAVRGGGGSTSLRAREAHRSGYASPSTMQCRPGIFQRPATLCIWCDPVAAHAGAHCALTASNQVFPRRSTVVFQSAAKQALVPMLQQVVARRQSVLRGGISPAGVGHGIRASRAERHSRRAERTTLGCVPAV